MKGVCCPTSDPVCGPQAADGKHRCCPADAYLCGPAGNDPYGVCCRSFEEVCCPPSLGGQLGCCPRGQQCSPGRGSNTDGYCCDLGTCQENADCVINGQQSMICDPFGCCRPLPCPVTPTFTGSSEGRVAATQCPQRCEHANCGAAGCCDPKTSTCQSGLADNACGVPDGVCRDCAALSPGGTCCVWTANGSASCCTGAQKCCGDGVCCDKASACCRTAEGAVFCCATSGSS